MSALPLNSNPSKLEEILKRVDQLAVLPHVVFKILEVSGSTDVSASDVEKIIIVDPGFSSKVLVLANSATFALPRKVSSIKEAIMFLGYKTVRSLAMTVGVFDMFVGKTDKESLRRRAWWRHSIDTAVGARWLAQRTRKGNADDAYTAGLLHCIGKTIMDRCGNGQYEKVSNLIGLGQDPVEAEVSTFGFNHADVSRAVSEKWGLPPHLQFALHYLEVPLEEGEDTDLRALVSVASVISRLAKEGFAPTQGPFLPAWTLSALNIESANETHLIEDAINAIAASELQV